MKEKIALQYEVNSYIDKQGNTREARNYYIEYPNLKIRIQLRPNDFTGRELLDSLVEQGLLEQGK